MEFLSGWSCFFLYPSRTLLSSNFLLLNVPKISTAMGQRSFFFAAPILNSLPPIVQISMLSTDKYATDRQVCYWQTSMLSTDKYALDRQVCYRQTSMLSTDKYATDRQVCYRLNYSTEISVTKSAFTFIPVASGIKVIEWVALYQTWLSSFSSVSHPSSSSSYFWRLSAGRTFYSKWILVFVLAVSLYWCNGTVGIDAIDCCNAKKVFSDVLLKLFTPISLTHTPTQRLSDLKCNIK